MKKYFKFRKDFRCNWNGILGAYDTTNLEEQIVEYDFPTKQKHKWHHPKSNLLATNKYYADIFLFESDGETQEYVNELNETLNGLAYFVKREDEYDTIEELCDELVIKYYNEEKPRIVNMFDLLISCNSLGLAFKKHIQWLYENYKDRLEICCLSIWVDAKLIPVAKLNDEGELELL